MPLEDLTGNRYLDSLNSSWPLGSDNKDAGDDHLRGIKNVLKRTFPNLTGPVLLNQHDMSAGGFAPGVRMTFYLAAPPAGWQRVSGLTNTFSLRVVATATAGGGTGGTDDPILNNKVASHVHPLPATTGAEDTAHSHTVDTGTYSGFYASNFSFASGASNLSYATPSSTHKHTVATSGGTTTPHNHVLGGNTSANAGAANWAPRYLDVILCERVNA